MADTTAMFEFGPFRLDPGEARLWRDGQKIALTPKALSMLQYLASRPDQLVTKEQLLDDLWTDTIVGDAVLKVTVRELRKALEDDAKSPRYIETVHRRGYRFVADVVASVPAAPATKETPQVLPSSSILVGRGEVTARLVASFAEAESGSRRIAFLTGEPGIGKTSVVEAFVRRLPHGDGCIVARGQCIEHYGSGEPYLPLLQAIGSLCRERPDELLVDAMAAHAPTWVAQIPTLLERVGEERIRRDTLGATGERMLREMADVLEVLSERKPYVLVLEDLHWCDFSTLEVLSLLARRRTSARLMVLGTYRKGDVSLGDPRRKQMLLGVLTQEGCDELALGELGEDEVAQYLDERFDGAALPERLPELLYARTGGQPLFLVHAVDHLLDRQILRRDGRAIVPAADLAELDLGVPRGLKTLIEERLARLEEDDRRLLQAGAVAGHEFGLDTVADAISRDLADLEERADRLADLHGLLRAVAPARSCDGRLNAWYGFTHAVIQETLYSTIPKLKRARLHGRIASSLENAYGDEFEERRTALARHFEAGGESERAIDYLARAAETAARRFANDTALVHLDSAFELLSSLPPETRACRNAALLEQRGLVQRSMGDMPGAARSFDELAAVARRSSDPDVEIRSLLLLGSAMFWVDRERCLTTVDRARAIASRATESLLRDHALGWCGHWNLTLRGWNDEDAAHAAHAVASCREAENRELLGMHLVRMTYRRMLQSEYGDAITASEEGTRLAFERGDAFDYLLGHFLRSWALVHAGRWAEALACLRHGREVAEKNGHELWRLLFGLVEAQLREQAFDFDGAARLCAPALAYADANPEAAGQLRFHGSIVLGLAELGRGRLDAAAAALDTIEATIADNPHDVDWMLRFPLRWGRAQLALQRQQADAAGREITRLESLATGSGERTYAGFAAFASAQLATLRGDDHGARVAVAAGLELASDAAPLAEWRLHAMAAQCAPSRDRAAQSQQRARACLSRLAKDVSLTDRELAESMTAAAPFLEICSLPPAEPRTRSAK